MEVVGSSPISPTIFSRESGERPERYRRCKHLISCFTKTLSQPLRNWEGKKQGSWIIRKDAKSEYLLKAYRFLRVYRTISVTKITAVASLMCCCSCFTKRENGNKRRLFKTSSCSNLHILCGCDSFCVAFAKPCVSRYWAFFIHTVFLNI